MKAAVLVKHNAPWELKEVKNPIPEAGQVLIKIHACGLCGTDAHIHQGHLPYPLPLIPGHEPVGEILQLGAGVTDLKVGDRVGVSWVQKGCGRCMYCQSKEDLYCTGPDKAVQTWANMGGGQAELMIAWAQGCTLLPANLDYDLAAPLFCAGYTIASGYANAAPKSGDKIAILGLGGLGHLALQYAKAKGHETFVITHSDSKREFAKKLGANVVITSQEHVGKALMKAGGVNIILHTGNSAKLAVQALQGLLPEGKLVNMSVDPEPFVIPPYLLVSKQLQIVGSKQNKRRDLIDILELTAQGKIKPIIEVFPLDQINEVLQRLIAGNIHFRAVLKPN